MLNGSMIPRTVRRIFDARSEPREEAGSQPAALELRGTVHDVHLVNLSASGAMIDFDAAPHIGEEIALEIQGRGRVAGHVCWVRDGQIGVTFAADTE